MYDTRLNKWYDENVAKEWSTLRTETMRLLQDEAELNEIVQLVGVDSLSFSDRIKLEATRSIREDYLHQNAFHDVDTYSSLQKQYNLLKLILQYYYKAIDAVKVGADFKKLTELDVREKIGRYKYTEEQNIKEAYEKISNQINDEVEALVASKEV